MHIGEIAISTRSVCVGQRLCFDTAWHLNCVYCACLVPCAMCCELSTAGMECVQLRQRWVPHSDEKAAKSGVHRIACVLC